MNLVVQIYKATAAFPTEEKYGLISQLRRASVSIPSNIAEGCRGSNSELRHFLEIAIGSAFEVETQLEVAKRVLEVDEKELTKLIGEVQLIQKRISSFRNAIKND